MSMEFLLKHHQVDEEIHPLIDMIKHDSRKSMNLSMRMATGVSRRL